MAHTARNEHLQIEKAKLRRMHRFRFMRLLRKGKLKATKNTASNNGYK